MKNKLLDFDDIIEIALNQENSEEDIIAEFVENEKMDMDLRFKEEELSLFKRANLSIADSPCCSNNCFKTWKKEHLKKHADDLEKLTKSEKKVLLLTILRNNAINSESTRYSKQRQRLRFSFRYEPFGKMCAPAFRILFDIRIEALKGLLAHLKANDMSVVPPTHGN